MDLCTYTELGMLMRRQANVEHVGDADCGSFAAVSKHLSTSPGSTDLDALVASIADDPFDLDEPMTVQPTVDSHSQNTLVPSLCEVKSKQSQILKSESVEPAAANKPSFHKIEVEPLAVERTSGISRSIRRTARTLRVSVFTVGPRGVNFVDVTAHEDCSIKKIIQDVILKFNSSCEHSEERIDDRIHIYEIRLAHEDGGPDYDSEAFTMRQELADIHCDQNKLALVVKHGSNGTTDNRMDRILLKVDVQQTEQQSACTQTIDASATDNFGDILRQLGRKMRQRMTPDRYTFYRTIGCEEVPISCDSLVDSIVIGTGSSLLAFQQQSHVPLLHHVTLRPKRLADEPNVSKSRSRKFPHPQSSMPQRFSASPSASAPTADLERNSCRDSMRDSIARPELILFSDLTASQHKEYHVYKLRGTAGVTREERVLGIDRERILNLLPRKGAGNNTGGLLGGMFEFERTTTTKPVHYVRDIRELHVDENENQRFHIAYTNVQGGLDRYEFEADSPLECAEIVAKINYLLALHRQGRR